jgi:hypothetical protein
VGQIALTVLMAALGAHYSPVWDKDQTIQITLVTSPIANSHQTEVRVSFDRIIVDSQENRRAELVIDQAIYTEFFNRFATSLSLEANPV